VTIALAPPERALRQAVGEDRRRRRRDFWTLYTTRIAILVAVLLAWELLSGVVLDPFFFSQPTVIWHQLVLLVQSGQFGPNVLLTVEEAFFGYVAGAIVATLAAAVLGLLPRAYAIVEPFVLTVYSIPSVAIGPLVIVWLGIGVNSKIILAAYFVFFVVFMNGVSGVRSVPPGWIDVTRVMGARRHQLVTKVVLRGAAPHLMTGLRTAVPQAVIGAIVGEFISSQQGIGYLISSASSRYNTPGVFAAILILSVLVLVMAVLLNGMSRLGARRSA
jgi:NitT/TauT family transport system permease protein